ncbi:MAG TPA: DinB family protein [Verrucomicrobiae bacterium]|nr:DinB family protein [Verrucomicrobiae bacterium]
MPSRKAPAKATAKASAAPFSLADSLIESFAINNRINEYLLLAIPDAAWRAEPPNGKGRTIAAIFAHIHNVRGMWLKVCAKGSGTTGKLDRLTCSKHEVLRALDESWRALEEVLQASLSADGRVRGFKPDAGAFLGYLIAHDAHHRGQITMLARQLGQPIPDSAMMGMWEWGKR